MKPTELFKTIVASISFLGELASVMRENKVPMKGGAAKVSSSKAGVREGATAWECDRQTQARLMLVHQGKATNADSITDMENRIAKADSFAKAGYALEKATGLRVDALYKSATAEVGAEKAKGGKPATAAPLAEAA